MGVIGMTMSVALGEGDDADASVADRTADGSSRKKGVVAAALFLRTSLWPRTVWGVMESGRALAPWARSTSRRWCSAGSRPQFSPAQASSMDFVEHLDAGQPWSSGAHGYRDLTTGVDGQLALRSSDR